MQTYQDIWAPVLAALKEKLSETSMDLWFNHLSLAAFSDTTAVLVADSDIKADILNKKYNDILSETFRDVLGFEISVVAISSQQKEIDYEKLQSDVLAGNVILPFQTSKDAESSPVESQKPVAVENTEKAGEPASQKTEDTSSDTTLAGDPFLNDEYTFENFIVGSSNKFAHAACVAVANNPATAYNPLFIWGASGLGKTHLLYAITNRIREKNPNAKIAYVKGETFTNQLIEAIATESQPKFREKYRQLDVFLIDDVQFIAGRVSTQEEFFNTFNELYEAKKQIILTSDRPPKEIKTLEDRIKTRFEWGLIADIQPPDLELRIAILKKKAQVMNIDIPIDVLNFLAEHLKSNIRQIEGVIKRLGAYSNLNKEPITIEMARDNIADVITGAEPVKVTQDKIFKAVAHKYDVTVEDIKGTKRTREIALARHICIYILRTITGMSLPAIGKLFNRDHTTILSSVDTITKKIRENVSIENDIDDLIKEIQS